MSSGKQTVDMRRAKQEVCSYSAASVATPPSTAARAERALSQALASTLADCTCNAAQIHDQLAMTY